jgi:hypothetical protein
MVFSYMMRCSLKDRYQQFGGICYQYLEEVGFSKVVVPTYLPYWMTSHVRIAIFVI